MAKKHRKYSPLLPDDFVTMQGGTYLVLDVNPQATKYTRDDGKIYAEIDWKAQLSSEEDGKIVYAWTSDCKRKTMHDLVTEQREFEKENGIDRTD